MALVKTSFSSMKDGFRFINRFEFKFPLMFKLPFAGEVNLRDVVYGLCGGMCFSSLDYYYAGRPIPDVSQVNQINPKLFAYLCDRQLDSLGLPTLIKVIAWMVSEDGQIGLNMSRYELPKLRRMLDKGNPAVLALIRVKGLGDPTHNHQVLATAYDYNPTTRHMVVTLYDPNHPGEAPTLTLDFQNPSKGIQISQSTGEYLRGFFIINYAPQRNVPLFNGAPPAAAGMAAGAPAFAASLDFAAPEFSLRWPVDSHRVNQYFGENPDTYKPFGLPGHEGLDLFALTNANVYACADGDVYQASHPKDHPYGLHIRIKHQAGGKTFHTIYAHLMKTFVKSGQTVSAGELIGLANNTGNSFGSHLHLTLKIDGEKTPGYPAGIVDPWPYLKNADVNPSPPPTPEPPPRPLPPPSGLTVYTTIQLNLRAGPSTDTEILGFIPTGEGVSVLGDAAQARAKIGKEGEWLQVQTASGLPGYVAAWFVQTIDQAFPPSDLVVYPDDLVNLRSGPATVFDLLGTMTSTDPLTVLGDANNARSKIGKMGEWLQIQTSEGVHGFVAAWLVHTTGQTPPASDLTVFSTVLLNVRARPGTDSNVLTVVTPNDALTVLGDMDLARSQIGQMDQWLNVRTPDGYPGYVAAWLVREAGGQPPSPAPAPDTTQLTVYPTADLNVRAQASINSPRVGGAFRGEALQVVEADLNAARDKIGKQDEWLHVQVKDGRRGWAAAWFLSAAPV